MPAGMTAVEYLDLVRDALPSALDAVRPDLVIYNAGSDPFIGDPQAGLCLAISDLAERDLLVVSLIRERSIPVAMVLSGGYSTESWRIHADGIEGILTRFDKRRWRRAGAQGAIIDLERPVLRSKTSGRSALSARPAPTCEKAAPASDKPHEGEAKASPRLRFGEAWIALCQIWRRSQQTFEPKTY